MEWLLILGFAAAFAVANRLRGTKSYLVAVPILVLVVAVWWATQNTIFALVAGLLFWAGESYGWTKWIRGIPGLADPQDSDSPKLTQKAWNKKFAPDRTGYKAGYAYILDLFIKERENYHLYCVFGGILRGIWWFGPVLASFWWFGVVAWPTAVLATIVLGCLFTLCYYLGAHWKIPGHRYLQTAEIYYGFSYGFVLSGLLFSARF